MPSILSKLCCSCCCEAWIAHVDCCVVVPAAAVDTDVHCTAADFVAPPPKTLFYSISIKIKVATELNTEQYI